jgi:hypothetical protein
MYAAYQLHVWLKTVKIVRVYLVQLSTLTSDCTSKPKDPGIHHSAREAGKTARALRFLWWKGCIRLQQAGRILRHHYVIKRRCFKRRLFAQIH